MPLLQQRAVGERLWDFTATQFLTALRRALTLLQFEGAQGLTLKAFRAGHAHELAKSGAAWAQILLAGEWRSLAALSYVDSDQVDEAAAAWEAIQGSESEGT